MVFLSKLRAKIDVSNLSGSFSDLEIVVRETKDPTSLNSPVDQRHTSCTFTLTDRLVRVKASLSKGSTSASLASS